MVKEVIHAPVGLRLQPRNGKSAGCAEDIRDQIYIGLMEAAEGTETMEVCRVATDRGRK